MTRDGWITTFYSYKGGVGRSFTLSNVAATLSGWGYRVLCIDWDLEAPGLSTYFQRWLDHEPSKGLLDLVHDWAAGRPQHWNVYTASADPSRERPDRSAEMMSEGLTLLPSGGGDPGDYIRKLQQTNWAKLYDDGFGPYLEELRRDWIETFDFVLIDSRTGVTDIGGICTIHLPDTVVLMFASNKQSVAGVRQVADMIGLGRNRLPFSRPAVTAIPVPGQFATSVHQKGPEWMRYFAETFEDLCGAWLPVGVSVEDVMKMIRMPYVPFWSFGEELPAAESADAGPLSLRYVIETLSALIALRGDHVSMLLGDRDAYVELAKSRSAWGVKSRKPFTCDVFISGGESSTLAELVAALRADGRRVTIASDGDAIDEQHLEQAKHVIMLVDGSMTQAQLAQARLLVDRTWAPGERRNLIPVLTPGTSSTALVSILSQIPVVRMRDGGSWIRDVVESITDSSR